MAYWLDIANAARTVLLGISGWPTTSVRMDGTVLSREKDDDLPLCVISFGQDEPNPGVRTMHNLTPTEARIYGIVVALYRANPGNIASGLATNRDLIQAARRAFDKQTLSGVPVVWQAEIESNDAWEGQPFGDGAEVSSFGVRYYTAEARN